MNVKGNTYHLANPIELIHKQRKDVEITQYITRLISDTIRPVLSAYINIDPYLPAISKTIYFYLCYVVSSKSLGEEYTYLSSYSDRFKVFLPKSRFVKYFLLKTIGEVLVMRFVK